MASEFVHGKALVSHGRLKDEEWRIEHVLVRPLEDNEVLVQVIASGICHTDLMVGDWPSDMIEYPRVLGHEGSGYVKAVGRDVTVAQPGDPVVLSFAYCGRCQLCVSGLPSYCDESGQNFYPTQKDFSLTSSADNTPNIYGHFFGQSSFASMTVAHQSSVVNVKDQIRTEEELKLFACLGCGIQTGSGTIINCASPQKDDVVVVIGLGAVGLAGVMAASMKACRQIIGIDKTKTRVALARELGATHTIDTSSLESLDELPELIRSITNGTGPTITMDTTGFPDLIRQGIEFTRRRGTFFQVGSAPQDAKMELPIFKWMASGVRLVGILEGDAQPNKYIPEMIEWYRGGNFCIEKLAKFFPVQDWEIAVDEMKTGQTIKPIILW